ncbi:MAG: cysteine desulfurase NifS [Clostridia bacterium]|nr:cysteine desulfurase NifS [Clostridia bacterium]
MIIYFDNAATTKVKKEVFDAMTPYFCDEYGNPSSMYNIGRRAKRAIEEAREKVAGLIGADKHEIYFTGCGSESDNTALKGIAYKNREKGNHIITTKIEHHAILESCKQLEKQGFEITYLNVDKDGLIDLEELENAITEKTILISIMFANNEIGTIEPIEKIAKIAKEKNIIFHTDAVQAIGNIEIDVKKVGIDMLSMSGHKIYGPKGIGALYVKKGIEFEKFISGGHQERNKRAGTENVAGIVGMGKACELAKYNLDEHINNLRQLRDYYVKQVEEKISDIKINGSIGQRLPGNSNISFKGVDAEALLLELDKRGICASSGSACTSGDTQVSHVLSAIGLSEDYSKGALRVTFGEFNTKAQVDYLVENLVESVRKLRNI